MLGRAFSLFFDSHSSVGGRICSSVVGIEASRSSSRLQCEVVGIGLLLVGKKLLHIPLYQPIIWRSKNKVLLLLLLSCFSRV